MRRYHKAGKDAAFALELCHCYHVLAAPNCVRVVKAQKDKEDERCADGEDGNEDCGKAAVEEYFGEIVYDDGGSECFEERGKNCDDGTPKGGEECGERDVKADRDGKEEPEFPKEDGVEAYDEENKAGSDNDGNSNVEDALCGRKVGPLNGHSCDCREFFPGECSVCCARASVVSDDGKADKV